MGLPSSSRNGRQIDWAALHSAEGARTVESLFGFFDRGQHASSHAGADGYRLSEPWVPDERAAWTLLNGNPRSLNLELCGFARWTREQWLSEGWVDGVWNPRQMIRHAAAWLREKCDRHNIPRRLLTAEEVGRGMRGIIDHARYTYGTGDGNHTDVGKNFPWDVLFADLNEEDSMSEEIVRNGLAGWLKVDLQGDSDQRKMLQDLILESKIEFESPGEGQEGWSDTLGVVIREMDRRLLRVEQKAVADVDEDALADALAKRGAGGTDPAVIKAAMAEVITATRFTLATNQE